MAAKILVVDDEKAARITLAEILRLEGYSVVDVANGTEALKKLQESAYDLMLLDIMMPGIDGISVLQRATKIAPDTMVILLTAHGSMESAIDALRHGAHDYLIKPSSPQEILSSVAGGLSRRTETHHKRLLLDQLDTSLQQLRDVEGISQSENVSKRVISFPDGIMVDLARREIWRGNYKVSLTPTEGKLFQVLIENQGRVMMHRELVFLVQGYEITDWEAPEVLRPLVSRLRRKLTNFPGGDKWILNVRGTGYVFELLEEE
jgi:DNA-binding response OmpR family regulator